MAREQIQWGVKEAWPSRQRAPSFLRLVAGPRATSAFAKISGHKGGVLSGHRDWLIERTHRAYTLRGLVAELAERGVKVD